MTSAEVLRDDLTNRDAAQAALIPLVSDDLAWAGPLLARSFVGDPMVEWVAGDGAGARARGEWLVSSSLRYGLREGCARGAADRSGVVFWLEPGATSLTLGGMWRAGMLRAPFVLGVAGFRRFLRMTSVTDAVHARLAPGPHVYLFGLGVEPELSGRGVGTMLVSHVVERARALRVPAYVETQNERNVPLYERAGFAVRDRAELAPGVVNVALVHSPSS